MWQMTLEELTADEFTPIRKPMHLGAWGYECPICGLPVGIYRSDDGMVFQRDQCSNGHRIKWTVK